MASAAGGGQNVENVSCGAGNDAISGGAGNTTLAGGAGDDTPAAGAGNDALIGGAGDDLFPFGPAPAPETDSLGEDAGGGSDTIDFALGAAPGSGVTLDLRSPTTALGGHANRVLETLSPGQGRNLENVLGAGGDDLIEGNAADNLLAGRGGNDTLDGERRPGMPWHDLPGRRERVSFALTLRPPARR